MITISKYSNTVEYKLLTTLDSSGITKLQAELTAVQTQMRKLSQQQILGDSFYKAIDDIGDLKGKLNKNFNSKLGVLDISSFSKDLKNSQISLESLRQSYSLLGSTGQSQFVGMLNQISKLDTGFKSMNKTVDKVWNTFGNTMRWGATASIFQGMMNSLHDSATYVKDLDASLTNIMMVTDYSRDAMNEYAKTANKVAKQLGSTTVAVTEGSQVFSQAGYDLPQATQLSQMSIKLANASGQTSDVTSDQIVAYMNAYGMDKDMGKLSQALDAWAEVANVSAADVKELATASQKAASTANTVGVNMDQLAAQIATIESVTKDAPENIGNGLKTVYARFSDISMGETLEDGVDLGQVTGALGKAGINALDSNGQMRNVGDIMEDLMDVWGQMDQTQKAAIATTLAGKYQLSRFEALMNRSDLYDQYKQSAQEGKEKGTLDVMNEKYVESLDGKLNKLQATFEGIMNTFANSSDFYGFVDALQKTVDLLNQMVDSIGGGSIALQSLGAIGVKTFSKQIGSNIARVYQNRQVKNARQDQSEQLKSSMARLGFNNINDPQYATLKKVIGNNLNMASNASDDQKERMNSIQDKYAKALQQRIDAEGKVREDLHLADLAYRESLNKKSTFKVSRDADTGEVLSVMGSKYKANYAGKIRQMAKQQSSSLDAVHNYFLSDESVKSFRKNSKASTAISDQLKELADATGLGEESFAKVRQEMEQLKADVKDFNESSDDSDDKWKGVVAQVERVKQVLTEASAEAMKIAGYSDDKIASKLDEINENAQKNIDASKIAAENERQTGREAEAQQGGIRQEQKVTGAVNAVGAIGQLGISAQSIQNLSAIWNDKSITSAEKLSSTLESMLFNIPMLVSGVASFSDALKDMGVAANVAKTATIGLSAATAVITAGMMVWNAYQQSIQSAKDAQQELADTAKSTNDSAQQTISDWESLYKTFQQTGVETDELVSSSIALGETLGDSSLTALAASKNYDALAQSLAKVKEQKLQDVIDSNNAILNGEVGKSVKGEHLFESSLGEKAANAFTNATTNTISSGDFASVETSDYINGLIGQYKVDANASPTTAIANMTEAVKKLNEEQTKLGTSYDEYKQTAGENAMSLEEWTLHTNELTEAQENLNNALNDENTQAYKQAQSDKADARTQQQSFQDKIKGANGDVSNIETIFGTDLGTNGYYSTLYDELEKLEYISSKVADDQTKIAVESKKASIEIGRNAYYGSGENDDAAKKITDQIKSSMSSEDLISFAAQLDVPLTTENVQSQIEQFLNNKFSVSLSAKIDTSDIKASSETKSGLQDLVDKYNQTGKDGSAGFSEDEAAGIISEHPEYLEYLTKVGDTYQLNTRALADYTDATNKQSAAMDEAYGKTVDLVAQNKDLDTLLERFAGTDLEGPLSQLKQLNLQLMNGDISNSGFLDGLSNGFDDLTSAIQNSGESFNDFVQDIGNADFVSMLTDELYQGMGQLSKQIQAGEISMGEYQQSMSKAARQAIKLKKAQYGLSSAEENTNENASKQIDITEDMTSEQKKQAAEVNKLSRQLTQLDAAADFNNYVTSNFEDMLNVFDESGHVLQSATNEMGGIQDQYSGLIDGLASTMVTYYSQNEEAAQATAENIAAVSDMTVDSAKTMLQTGEDLASTMQNNTAVAGAAMEGTMNQTSAAIGQMANGIAGIITSIMSQISGINGEVDGTVEQTGDQDGGAITITSDDGKGGTTIGHVRVPGFKLKVSGSGSSGGGAPGSATDTSGLTNTGRVTQGNKDWGNDSGLWTEYTDSNGNSQWRQSTQDEAIGYYSKQIAEGWTGFLGANSSNLKWWAPQRAGSGKLVSPSGGSGRGGSGGGGGGGGGSSYTPKTKDRIDDEADRYERVNTQLEKIGNELDRIADEQDRLTGDKLAKNMEKQIQLLQRQKELQQEKLQIEQQEAQELQNKLSSQYGVQFDSEGYMSNYYAIHQGMIDNINNLTDQYNNTSDEAGQDALEKQIEDANKALDKFNTDYQRYDDLWAGDLEDTKKALEDIEDQIEDIRISAFKKGVEAADDIKDIQESLIEFNSVYKDIYQEDPFNAAADSVEKLGKYFDVATGNMSEYYDTMIAKMEESAKQEGVSDSYKTYAAAQIEKMKAAKAASGNGTVEEYGTGYLDMAYKNVNDMMEQINQFNKTGKSDIFGENSAEMYEVAKDIFDQATSLVNDYSEEVTKLRDHIIDCIDKMADAAERRQDSFQAITDQLEHQLNIVQMLHGENAYDEMNAILDAQQGTYIKQISEAKQVIDSYKELLAKLPEGSEEWKAVQDKIIDAQSKLNDLVETSLEKLQQKYENTVNKITNAWVKSALGTDVDWMSTQWELINRNADYYLDDVNRAYNIQKLQGKYLELLDKSNDLNIQKKITDQMKQQLDTLHKKTKLSEYDVQYANAQLEILQKQIALEDAQRNKNQMKLRRDTQGNYSYVYTANQDNVRSAESDLLDAKNNAYNLSKDQMKQTQDDSLSALKDAQSTLNDIWTNANLTLEEKKNRTTTIIDSLKEYLTATGEQLGTSEQNIIKDFLGMCEMLTDENKTQLDDVYQQLLQKNNDAFDQIDTRWNTSLTNWLKHLGDFNTSTENMSKDLISNSQAYQEKTDEVANAVKENFNDVKDVINGCNDATKTLAGSTESFINQLNTDSGKVKEYENNLQSLTGKITDMTNTMGVYKQQLKDMANELTKEKQENLVLRAEIEQAKNGSGSGGSGGSGSGGGSTEDIAYRIANSIWNTDDKGGWGDDPTRNRLITQRYGHAVYEAVQALFNSGYGYNGWIDLGKGYEHYDTGGYTGEWGQPDNTNGRFAMLHQKELVLNETDTANILEAVRLVRDMTENGLSNMVSSAQSQYNSVVGKLAQALDSNKQSLDQNVQITAEFPNAENFAEIRAALESLNGYAAQYAYRTK